MKHLPNSLTIARILLTPVFLVLMAMGTFVMQAAGLAVFIAAAVSDYLDGMLARKYGVASDVGRYLDPLADKILVLSAFCLLAFMMPDQVPWWAVAVIAVRDVTITAMRARAQVSGVPMRTLPMAKTKTAVQLTFLIVAMLLLVLEKLPGIEPVREFATALLEGPFVFLFLMVVVVLTVVSGALYFKSDPSEQGVET